MKFQQFVGALMALALGGNLPIKRLDQQIAGAEIKAGFWDGSPNEPMFIPMLKQIRFAGLQPAFRLAGAGVIVNRREDGEHKQFTVFFGGGEWHLIHRFKEIEPSSDNLVRQYGAALSGCSDTAHSIKNARYSTRVIVFRKEWIDESVDLCGRRPAEIVEFGDSFNGKNAVFSTTRHRLDINGYPRPASLSFNDVGFAHRLGSFAGIFDRFAGENDLLVKEYGPDGGDQGGDNSNPKHPDGPIGHAFLGLKVTVGSLLFLLGALICYHGFKAVGDAPKIGRLWLWLIYLSSSALGAAGFTYVIWLFSPN